MTAISASLAAKPARFDAQAFRAEFPALDQQVYGKALVYLDNASTTHKPREVIEAVTRYYAEDCANVHRAVHALGERASAHYEDAREAVRQFIGAARTDEIIFVRGATEGINLVASGLGRSLLAAGDEVVVSAIEHHSNIVPWQMACEASGARLRVAPVNDAGEILVDALAELLGPHTRVVAITHLSNALGTIVPVEAIVDLAHQHGALVVVDGAQAAAHLPIDVQEIGCDFYVFSGHKVYGPTGIGVLYGKRQALEALPPYQGGGDMIRTVTFEKTTYAALPHRLEAGTPNIAGAIGLSAALDFLSRAGRLAIAEHEAELLEHATSVLAGMSGAKIFGAARHKAAVLAFAIDGAHPHDVATIVDREGVAIRAGHHCAQPVWQRYGVSASARASFAAYNTHADVEALARALHRVREVFA